MGYEEDLAIERAARKEVYTRVAAVAGVVAGSLGDGWSVEATYDEMNVGRVELRHTDGRNIGFDWIRYNFKGKIEIRGYYQYGSSDLGISLSHRDVRPDINVSLDRGGVAIAKDIQRRFLADYTKLFLEVSERVRAATEYRDNCLGLASRLAALAGAKTERISTRGFSYNYQSKVREAKVSDKRVDITIEEMTEAQAVELITLVKSWEVK